VQIADSSNSIRKLEFDRVLDRVSRHASSDAGKHAVGALRPMTDAGQIAQALGLVSETKSLLIAAGDFPFEGLSDVRATLKKTTIENSILSPEELLQVAGTLRASRLVHAYMTKNRSLVPSLADLSGRLILDKIVEYNIRQAIEETGRISDSASKELRSIRSGMVSVTEQLRKRLAAILKNVSEQEFLQEEIVTTRDGRLVIPVKTEFKRQVPGFIHSSSASGATTFIEPAETLDLNNQLRELQLAEQREILKILGILSDQVRQIREPLETSLEALTELDVLSAKARYSIEVLGNEPVVREGGALRLVQARHPVLLERHGRAEVVPLSMEFPAGVQTLLITGPNAGGKSVALKTVGLLALLAQSGLHVPADPGTELPIFRSIFVDIGDDQSIENDLSTFSSTLLTYRGVLDGADSSSLILLDELGAGTDPAEGGALATAMLTELTRRKATTIATTHTGSLKVFAHDTAGMMNGSMEFDQKELRPTYRFVSGVPGGSYAFELAERLNFPQQLLAQARKSLGTDQVRLENLLLELERKAQEYSALLAEATAERDRLQSLVGSYESKLREVRKEVAELKKSAKTEAHAIIKEAQSTVERVVREIREQQASPQTVRGAKQELKQIQERHSLEKEEGESRESEPIAAGDSVCLEGSTQVGQVLEIRAKSAVVSWSHGKIQVPLAKLRKAKRPEERAASVTEAHVAVDSKNEIDVRGMRVDEVQEAIEHFLDSAFLGGLRRVDIIHGKGTGALRKRVTELLKTHPQVRSFRMGEWNEGGTGVTVVELETS
jgi:DNA mismatch repair protein MutS2